MPLDGQYLGLDIGQSHITAVRLIERASEEGGLQIEPLLVAEIGLPRGTFNQDGELRRPELVTDAVKQLRKTHKIKTKDTLLALSGAALTINPAQRPAALDDDQIRDSIAYEIGAALPYEMEAAHIDYQEVRRGSGEGAQLELLTVAVHRRVPTLLARAVTAAGLRVRDVLAEPLILPRALNLSQDGTEVLLTIGMLSSTLMVIRGGKVAYAQSMNWGADHFTRQLIEQAGMDPATAERWKRTHSLIAPSATSDPYAKARAALRAIADKYVEELYGMIAYARSEGGATSVRRLVVAGGGAQLSGLLLHLKDSLNIPVELVEPAEGLIVEDRDAFPRQALAYALAMTTPEDLN